MNRNNPQNAKTVIRQLALALAVSGLVGGAASAYAATSSGTATAEIITAISIANNQDLAFGSIVPSSTGDTVAVATDGTVTCGANVTCVDQSTKTAGAFTVSGEAGYSYAITLPSGDVQLSNGTETMTVNNFSSNPSGTGTLTGGTDSINVGGTLNVSANQAQGSYSGSYDVTVEYN